MNLSWKKEKIAQDLVAIAFLLPDGAAAALGRHVGEGRRHGAGVAAGSPSSTRPEMYWT